ncbi:type VII secretion protein EccB [Micromonospora pisi]|uniref:Type VII secretion protein EccB n=1 Tax=Micromonospora pisi TaxID=589240 RepID=A0A495JPC6_9ACTN|nr:type VII secretion protein EccB [Micromonospora pisi]RKR89909.1 type VII secretion protein EccB [Micromonospora pisi]
MRTRRDQVQAYRFVTRRIVSALLSGDPETNNLPMRRLGLAVFGSAMAAAIVLAGAGVYGLVTKRSSPLEPNTLVVERETGATYVFVDDLLYPTLNYTSARLILDEADPQVRTMSQASIQDRPRGPMVGIVGAPDDLPGQKSLVGLPWSVCNTPNPTDSRQSTTRLVVNQELAGGVALADRAVLITNNRQLYLLTNNTRMQITGGAAAMTALKMASVRPVEVGPQLLNAIPVGPRVREPGIAGNKEPSRLRVGPGPARVGQVFRSAGQHYVLTRIGLAPIGEITALLLLRDGGVVKEITPQQAGQALSQERLEDEGMPQRLPEVQPAVAGSTSICATYRDGTAGSSRTTIEVFDQTPPELTPSAPGSIEVRQSTRDAVQTAQRVVMPGGKGALVQAMPGSGGGSGGAPGATVYLVTSQGVRYPLGTRDGDAVTALGYGGVTPLGLPASVLALVPTGPTLQRSDALRYFAPGSAPSPARSNATPTARPSQPPSPSGTPSPAGSSATGSPATPTARPPQSGQPVPSTTPQPTVTAG